MNPQIVLTYLRLRKLPVVKATLLASLSALCVVSIVTGTAQSPTREEREVEEKIPKHLPIKVKIKNLDKVKDLTNESWLRDFEVEVENIGNKPIYFLKLTLFFTDVQSHSGNQLGFPLEYGRHELLSISNRATEEDVPLRPGETHTFKFSEERANRWSHYRAKHQKPHPKKVGLRFHVINYGDGTGFHTSDGLPVPRRRAANTSCGNEKVNDIAVITASYAQSERSLNGPTHFRNLSFKVTDSPFFLSRRRTPSVTVSPPQSGLCCPGTSCYFLREAPRGNCFCEGDQPFSTETVSCDDLYGECCTSRPEDYICPDGEHTCSNSYLVPCGTESPTPTATPTPEPTPSPTPFPCRGEPPAYCRTCRRSLNRLA